MFAKWCSDCFVFEIAEMFHEPFSDAASRFTYICGCAVCAVITCDFVDSVFGVTFPCQTRLTRVASAATRWARWWLQGRSRKNTGQGFAALPCHAQGESGRFHCSLYSARKGVVNVGKCDVGVMFRCGGFVGARVPCHDAVSCSLYETMWISIASEE